MPDIELGAAAEATVRAYKELAVDPAKKLALASDETCVQFLAYSIAEGKEVLIQLAVDTLASLAKNIECHSTLAGVFGILEALQTLAEDESKSEELREKAISLFTKLHYSRCVPKKSVASESVEAQETKVGECTKGVLVDNVKSGGKKVSGDGISMPFGVEAKKKLHLEKKASAHGKAKVYTLRINGMDSQEHRKRVEDELVRIRGLISIVFDLTHSQVTCRVKRNLSIEKLALAVAKAEFTEADYITVADDGSETVIPLINAVASEASAPLDDLPDYLPEEDSPVKNTPGAMTHKGSLRETATSFFSSATNFLQQSFYW